MVFDGRGVEWQVPLYCVLGGRAAVYRGVGEIRATSFRDSRLPWVTILVTMCGGCYDVSLYSVVVCDQVSQEEGIQYNFAIFGTNVCPTVMSFVFEMS